MPKNPFHDCFTAILPHLSRSGQKIDNVHNLQFVIKLNDLTICRRIFHEFTPQGKLNSKYLGDLKMI